MKYFMNVLFIILPFYAMYLVLKNKMMSEYRVSETEHHQVLMYLDLTMYVLVAFALGTLLKNIVTYRETKERKAFAPTFFISFFAFAISMFNLFIYETEQEKANKELLAQELQLLQEMQSEVVQQEQSLDGYWLKRDEEGNALVVYQYKDGMEQALIRNTGFQKGDPAEPFEMQLKDDVWLVKVGRSDLAEHLAMRFQDADTIVVVQDTSKGMTKWSFHKHEFETMLYELERVTEEELAQIQKLAEQQVEERTRQLEAEQSA